MRRGILLLIEIILIFIFVIVFFVSNKNTTGFAIDDICIDSDGGENFEVNGSITWNGDFAFGDFCNITNSFYITEYYCNSTNDIKGTIHFCVLGCFEGACNTKKICTDSDNGANLSAQGTTTGRNTTHPNLNITATDYCLDNNTLIEYGCGLYQKDYLMNETFNCEFGCSTGICNSTGCLSNWSCTDWSNCINDVQTKTCTDLNNCTNSTNIPATSRGCISPECVQNWSCGDWSECIGENQIRTCADLNLCGNESRKPVENQPCGIQCIPQWDCDEWDPEECPKTQTKKRTCTDLNSCNKEQARPPENESCIYKENLNKIFIPIIIIVSILIITIIILLITFWKKLKLSHNLSSQPKKL